MTSNRVRALPSIRPALAVLATAGGLSLACDPIGGSTSTAGATSGGSSGVVMGETSAPGSSSGERITEATTSAGSGSGSATDGGTTSTAGSEGSGSGSMSEAVTTGQGSLGGTGTSTGGDALGCWAKACDDEHPCVDGLVCELHPDAVGMRVCSAPCESCASGLFYCTETVPHGECMPNAIDELRCFPRLCASEVDCKGGEACIDGLCYGA